MRNKRQVLRWSQYVLAAIGVVALGYWGAVFLNTRLYQARATRAFEGKLRTTKPESQPAPGSQPTTTARHEGLLEGSVVAQLAIPRLGLESIVVEGVEAQDLRLAPGHIPGTPLPGQAGNVAIAGHRDTFFRPLRLIRKNDVIQLTTLHGEDQYSVVSTEIVTPSEIQVLYPTRPGYVDLGYLLPVQLCRRRTEQIHRARRALRTKAISKRASVGMIANSGD